MGKMYLTISKKKNVYNPIWIMRQAGRYLPEYKKIRHQSKSFIEFCLSVKKIIRVTLQPLQRFDMDAAIIFSDILIIPYALNQKVFFNKNNKPNLKRIKSVLELEVFDYGKVRNVYKSIFAVKEILQEKKDLIGFAGGVWTILCYMINGKNNRTFNETKRYAYNNPIEFNALLTILENSVVEHLAKQIYFGAKIIQIFESWSNKVPAEYFNNWVINPTKRIVYSVRRMFDHVVIIGFPKESGVMIYDYADKTKIDCLSVDTKSPLRMLKNNLNKKVPLQGNLDPELFKTESTFMKSSINKNLSDMKETPYVLNLGEGISPDTPITNIEYLLETIRKFKIEEVCIQKENK
jgi:uroporphyrinogen decarboxylase